MYRILIAEDDSIISSQLARQLSEWGFETSRIEDFREVMSGFQEFQPSLVILDIKLPFFNGYHWCTEIRKVSRVPVIFVSSASDSMNIVMAMNMGGDDFIAKPFDMNVLVAKIQALLRRSYSMPVESSLLECRGLELNTDDSSVTYGGRHQDLTKNEYRILKILMENQGRIISRDQLMQRLWDTNEFIDDNTLTVNITRLRKTLESLGLTDFIITRKGAGYQI
jgi:DNA-binding response OmpR family regulator